MIDVKEIMELVDIHPLKIKNIYVYGSHVYKTNHPKSDYNVLVVANYMTEKAEIDNGKYRIQIHTPQKFRRDLDAHDMFNLECIYAPKVAKLQEKINYNQKFKLNKNKFKKTILAQSNTTWINGQKYIKPDSARKAIFNSIKILYFGKQVLTDGKINNFTEANHIWEEVKNNSPTDMFAKYSNLKNTLEQEILKIK
jgi:predicted nucleotidyltransferase